MERRKFINQLVLSSSGLIFLPACNLSGLGTKKVSFAICADVHQDIIHDAPERVSTIISEAQKENVDFIIQLGDFCFPKQENQPFMEQWNAFEGPKYHVFGNHDMDVSSKKVTQEFWGMEKPFYSFDQGDFHFVVLDPNYFVHEGKYVDYENGNYYAHANSRANIPPHQIEWLQNDLESTEKLTIVFSHQSLVSKNSIKNQDEVRKVLEQANNKTQKVIACFNGHEHDDDHTEINGIHYIGINSASYKWVGNKYEYAGRFDEETNKKRPSLKYTIPFTDAVFAIVTINTKGVLTVKGKESTYTPPSPEELGIKTRDGKTPENPKITNRSIKTLE